MFLSQMLMDTPHRDSARLLKSPSYTYSMLLNTLQGEYHGGGDDGKRLLWRSGISKGTPEILMITPQKPDFSSIESSFGWSCRSRSLDGLLDAVKEGKSFQFRLTANAVRKRLGKLCPCKTPEARQLWVADALERNGARLLGSARDETVVESVGKRGHSWSMQVTRFDGTLVVEDRDKLLRALTGGIGRERAYGCGMITISAA